MVPDRPKPETPKTVSSMTEDMAGQDYILSDGLAVSLFLALRRQRPLFLEGEAGSARPRWQRRWRRCLVGV